MKSFTIRVDNELYDILKRTADKDGRSLNNAISHYLTIYLNARKQVKQTKK